MVSRMVALVCTHQAEASAPDLQSSGAKPIRGPLGSAVKEIWHFFCVDYRINTNT